MTAADRISNYDVVWDSPSADATGSMPIGNGDLAANVWVEPTGDVLILLAKGDAWDENSSLLKLGRVRVRCEPPLRAADRPFCQSLHLADASIRIEGENDLGSVRITLYADANRPAIRLSVDAAYDVAITASLESWRTYPYRIVTQTGDLFKNLTGKDPYPTIVTPDEPPRTGDGRVVVCHHNRSRSEDAFEINLKLQGLGAMRERIGHPLLGRTFGMAIVSDGGRSDVKSVRRSGREVRFDFLGLTLCDSTPDAWFAAMDDLINAERRRPADCWERHGAWWAAFWERSHLFVTSDRDSQAAVDVTRAYALQRYMNASAGRAFAIKHNGSLFSVGRPWDPDFRRWGGPGFWFMNQRLIYWPMMADGDFDLVRPWLKMYRDTLPLQTHRTRKYFGHAGAHFPETMTFWGTEVSAHYGWTPFEQRERPEAECAYLTYYWSGAVELVLILSEFVRYAGKDDEVIESLSAIGPAVLTFYEQHYLRNADGTIRFEPAQALETWHTAVDPMPEIAGLRYTCARLLELPAGALSSDFARQAERLLGVLPPVPAGPRDGETVLLPAASFGVKKNTENPELYCVFPYRLYGVGKPDLDLARRSFDRRLHIEHTCWHQDVIQMALLGLTDAAKDFLTRRASAACHSDSRFPAFWNAFHDWVPDVDHGGVLQLALQNMLVQCEGQRIRLLPAWPAEWDVDFKLRVPGPATIAGVVRDGKLVSLSIDPPARKSDVTVDLKDWKPAANL